MRTTVSIDDHLLAQARDRAHGRRQTLGQLVEDALRRELSAAPAGESPPPMPVMSGGTGLRPGIDVASNRALREALDEGAPLERLR